MAYACDWQTNYQHTRSNDDDEFSGDANSTGVERDMMPGGRYHH
ncbi:hypothetical protein ACLBOM_13640 [Escherichia coli]